MTGLVLFAALPFVFWVALWFDRSRRWPAELTLPEEKQQGDDSPPRVVALVPARNEAAVLPLTLPTLLAQQFPGLEVVLIDDGSSDGTATVARDLGQDPASRVPLQVLQAPPARPGWSGKVHALAHGLTTLSRRGTAPDWLLLTDADIAHRPGTVTALLAQAESRDGGDGPYDLVSVMARLNAETFWERLLIPPFVFFFQLLYPFRRVRSHRSAVAAAAGGCVLVNRRKLETAGGFEALSTAVIDDVTLAKRIRDTGGRLWLGLDPGIRSVRRYERLSDLWQMVARTAFVQLRHSTTLLALTLVGLAIFVASPPWLAALATARVATGALDAWPAAALALAAWGLQTAALAPVVRHHGVPLGYAWTLPFASVFYGLMTWSSAWRHWRGRGAAWKGRAYS